MSGKDRTSTWRECISPLPAHVRSYVWRFAMFGLVVGAELVKAVIAVVIEWIVCSLRMDEHKKALH